MEINQFVENALTQIFEGVKKAQLKIEQVHSEGKPVINPRRAKSHHAELQKVEFDIAVTITSQSGQEGTGKLSVMGVSLGGNKSTHTATEAVSRIKFSIPIAMPSMPIDYPEQNYSLQR